MFRNKTDGIDRRNSATLFKKQKETLILFSFKRKSVKRQKQKKGEVIVKFTELSQLEGKK